jgi:putative CocE/NonD family hydrolase
VRLLRNLEIPLADGTVLAGDLMLPDADGPVPVIVTYIPYHKDDFLGGTYEGYSQQYFVEHGYATLMVDFRGLGSSSGVPLDAMHRQEAEDAAEMVEWAAAQEWCDGNVGMWGISYGGITSFKTAAAKPPHLKAIVPMMGSLDIYDDWVYPGGCRNMLGATGVWGSFMVAMQLLPPMFQDAQGRWHDVWRTRLEGGEPYLMAWPDHPDHDEYWRERVIDASRIEVPMLVIGGWRDLFPKAMIDSYLQTSGPRKLLMGPWLHTHPEESPFEAIDHLALMVRWWDRWLKGIENGVEDEPEAQFYSQGDGRWVQSPSWPPAGAQDVTLALGADGSLAAEAPAGELTHTTDPSTGTTAGLWDPFGLGIGLPLDQGPDEALSLTFTSAELETALRVTGSPEATLQLTREDGEHLQLVVKLSDVAPDGGSTLIATGWLNAQQVDAAEAYTVTLWPTAYAVKAGHRLRLSISGADFPRIWPTATNPTIRLAAGAASRLVLPTSPDEALEDYSPPGPREDVSEAERYPRIVAFDPKWEIARDLVAAETAVVTGGHFVIDTVTEGGRVDVDHTCRAVVRADSPEAAYVRADTIALATTPLGARVEIVVATLTTGFGTNVTGKVTMDGVTVFERAWEGGGHTAVAQAAELTNA